MPSYCERRSLPYSCAQIFDLVMDVGSYPDFLPWCQGAKIVEQKETQTLATLSVGYKKFKQEYTSLISCERPHKIQVTQHQGPFKFLLNTWCFMPLGVAQCQIDFKIDFEFESRIFQIFMGLVFESEAKAMVTSFERRAKFLYG